MTEAVQNNYPKRRLGKSDVSVTSLGFGTVPLAGFKAKASYVEFERVIKAAYDDGVRYFDCAPMYGFGKAEYYLGHALRELGIRNDVVVSTKVGRVLKAASKVEKLDTVYGIEWVDPLPFLDTYDYTYDGIMRSFEDSQVRLSLDYIDVLLVHDLGRAWHRDQADIYWAQIRKSGYKALDQLRAGGAVSAVGLGVNETDAVITVAREFEIDCSLIAGRYTLLNHEPLSAAFEELKQRNVSIIAGGVFNSGILATGVKGKSVTYDYGSVPEAVVSKVSALETVCEKYGVSLGAAAIEFVLMHPAVATVVLGAQNVDEVRQNTAATAKAAPREFWAELKQKGLLPENAPTIRLD
ncbi:aldo/keto reductase [Rhizobium leguminosarum bv. trifolii]|uniref:Aldo/keto reductase n=2 Tax=Rhizobium TaxID=379 RepID=A0A3E1B8H1_RHILT|nr:MULTISPECIES: aldo/keto reductase [Rhizobium]KPH05161.1 aldo/keto reductase [Rhizobium acidisoli]QAS81100.1 aldo/keto reductase [Rhizobium acidisoli]RFB86499.1 aldo/keto reductase [Rhizobium leguminosarum bv. trifolii]RFB86759.1 aldo/keto reductase [Rhizobium leguminosarum bv. trifolii]